MITYEHKDKLDQTLMVGDCVAYPIHNALGIGIITKLNPKTLKIVDVSATGFWARGTNKYPHDVVRLDGQDISLYLLKKLK